MKTARILTSVLFLTFVSAPPASAQPTFAGFADPVFVQVGFRPYDVKALDLNNDGVPDFVVANRGPVDDNDPSTPPQFGTVSVILSDGAGGYAVQQTLDNALLIEPTSLALADLNGDGLPDLVVGNGSGDNILVFVGENNPGPFATTPLGAFFAGAYVACVELGQVDGDSNLDIVTAAFGDGNVLTPGYGVLIMFGDANGTYRNTVFIGPTPNNPNPQLPCAYAVAVGDMNNDGLNDIVVTHFNGNCTPGNSDADLTVILNTGSRTFAVAQTLTFPPINNHPNPTATSPKLFDLVDLDNDGDLDVVTTRLYDLAGNPPQGNGFIAIFENLTNPNADFNGDGVVDGADLAQLLANWGPLRSASTSRLRWRHQS